MSSTQNLLSITPQEFVLFLKQHSIRRCYFVFDTASQSVKASHPVLQPIAEFFSNDPRDYARHEGVFLQVSREYDTLFGAFIHRTNRGQASGGTRYWQYSSMEAFLRDGLRLAKGMTHKNALAGIWWGGGKGIMVHNPTVNKADETVRKSLYREFGEMMTSLRGCYITAEDIGTNVTDMMNVFATTRFTTCISPTVGGSGNPSVPTARGVISGIEAALQFLGMGTIEGKTIAVQGMGNVGAPLIRFLFEKNAGKVIAVDINEQNVEKCKKEFAGKNLEAKVVALGDNSILATECDIVAPCATGAIINPVTIPAIKAKIICGAANNQLEDPNRDDDAVMQRGIIYVPDFLTNRMGIVTCADEQYGYVNNDIAIEQHLNRDWEYSVFQTTLRVLQNSKSKNSAPGHVAVQLAEELSFVNHPIWGHRGEKIIQSVIEDGWERS